MVGKPAQLRRFARIVFAFGWSDFTLKYHESFLGYLWSLAGPVVQFIVILHVFRPFIGQDIPSYHLYLFLGLILWEHFSLTTSACIALPARKVPIMRKVNLPRILFVLSVGWTHVIILCSRLLIFFLFGLATGLPFEFVHLWYVPLLLLQTTALALGIGMIFGSNALRFPDIPHLWGVALSILFWLTPVTYPSLRTGSLLEEAGRLVSAPALSEVLTSFIRLQPVSVLLYDARRALIFPSADSPPLLHIAAFTLLCLGIFAVGALMFWRRSRFFLQEF
jgi:ABC-type polysaccharide/polyol phosphate export permease